MSVHRSLRTGFGLTRDRNVWTRLERLEVLKRQGKWSEGETVLGLPKVRTRFKTTAKKKAAKGEKAEGEGDKKAEAKPAAKPAGKK
ncbi:MAG: small basic protein [Planctomycetes bacterium]|nr:small basic protein [Planctomycetota bacterium]